jgi:hypothetical protein
MIDAVDISKDLLEGALLKLHCWVQMNGWAGYDPYDLKHWNLQLARFIRNTEYVRSFNNLISRLEYRYPYLLRRLLRIKKSIFPSAMGLFTDSYVRMYEYFEKDEYLRLAKECASWLIDNVAQGYKGYGWGLPIDWQSRILIPKGTPCGTVSADCGEGFWKLYQVTGDNEYLDICHKICEGFIHDLNIDYLDENTVCFSYTPLDNFHVHNLNLLIAVFLVKIGQYLCKSSYLDLGERAANYAIKEQRDDGSLSYWGKDQTTSFQSDHYHTCFEIRALHSLWKLTGRNEYYLAAERYYNYYRNKFLGQDGAPFRNPDDTRVIDIHGCSEAINCNAQVINDFPQAVEILERTTRWTIKNMQSPHGYFIYRIVTKNGSQRRLDVPYIRWGQATMMHGLSVALPYFIKN